MKTMFRWVLPAILLAGSLAVQSCGGGKKAVMEEGEIEINVPCSGDDFFTTKKYFRANSVGESLDQSVSKKKALNNAKGELAGAINTTIKATIDNYVNSREMNNVEQVEERFEGLTREVIDQEIRGIKTICEKLFKTKDGKYKTYLAIELSAQDLLVKMDKKLAKDDQLKIDYDYEKFKATFEKEMENMRN